MSIMSNPEKYLGATVKCHCGIGKIIGIMISGYYNKKILVQFNKKFDGHNGNHFEKIVDYVGTLEGKNNACWWVHEGDIRLLNKREELREKLLQEVM